MASPGTSMRVRATMLSPGAAAPSKRFPDAVWLPPTHPDLACGRPRIGGACGHIVTGDSHSLAATLAGDGLLTTQAYHHVMSSLHRRQDVHSPWGCAGGVHNTYSPFA
ncbi:hypothetical protein PCL_09865 [Purpureocillium lilacinum]|uniref:Uncharacterized protein n=1 Tax=Purpureocillium lilacinum TaxID=33203 RepID=A0A2U3EEH4_PURLI|nr:hypothetical protein PCL_09865 [Purpureocillium lilacinum]